MFVKCNNVFEVSVDSELSENILIDHYIYS